MNDCTAAPRLSLSPRHLSSAEWAEHWTQLPRGQREPYWHLRYHEASARREQASAECLSIESRGGMLYPFLRHGISSNDDAVLTDVQTAYGYGGPLFYGEWSDADKRAALAGVRDALLQRGTVAEFVRCHTYWTELPLLATAGYRLIKVRTNVECELDAASFLEHWAPIARRNLRKAQNARLAWRVATQAEDWTEFGRLYDLTFVRANMQRSYAFDSEYLAGLRELPSEHVALIVVESPSVARPVAGAVVLFGGRVAHYHLGASDLAHRAERPNEYLYWAMASEAQRRGCERIVWGGGMSNDPGDSLFQFKAHFGPTRREVFVAGRILDQPRYDMLCATWERDHPAHVGPRLFLRYRG